MWKWIIWGLASIILISAYLPLGLVTIAIGLLVMWYSKRKSREETET